MDNTLDNFQPDNRIFSNLLITVLCFVFGFLYITYRGQTGNSFYWYDWTVLGTLLTVMAYFLQNIIKKNDYDNGNA